MPDKSVFDSNGWISAIKKCYGNPVFTIENIPVMEISIPFMGKKGISLPYSDFYPPRYEPDVLLKDKIEKIIGFGTDRKWNYYEYRGGELPGFSRSSMKKYITHWLDLTLPIDRIESGYKKRAVRQIKKAADQGLTVEFSTDDDSPDRYYSIHCKTRKRQGVPPQPRSFFHLLHKEMIRKSEGFYAFAEKEGELQAAQLFLHKNQWGIYKFGASSKEGRENGATYLLMRESIKHLKEMGIEKLSFGRTKSTNEGLILYKDSWGARKEELIYTRIDISKRLDNGSDEKSMAERLRPIFRHFPLFLLKIIGSLFYKYAG